ncbi:MAG: hypothetical protein QM619_13885 [Micropruina sp.]|uniref:hypothetical protein n=1 Tax=Micropruina sp. TaxID=2737536 RepID=UPI0039E22042
MRRLALVLVSAFMLSLALCGCGNTGNWVVFVKSGGLANAKSTVVVSHDGVVTVTKPDGSSSFQLSSDQHTRLESALASAKSVQSVPSSSARDSYHYELTVDGVARSWDDSVEPGQLTAVREFFETETGI